MLDLLKSPSILMMPHSFDSCPNGISKWNIMLEFNGLQFSREKWYYTYLSDKKVKSDIFILITGSYFDNGE